MTQEHPVAATKYSGYDPVCLHEMSIAELRHHRWGLQ